jgi:hypothetical protein
VLSPGWSSCLDRWGDGTTTLAPAQAGISRIGQFLAALAGPANLGFVDVSLQAVIDESGHRALTPNSSDHFVMSAVVYDNDGRPRDGRTIPR